MIEPETGHYLVPIAFIIGTYLGIKYKCRYLKPKELSGLEETARKMDSVSKSPQFEASIKTLEARTESKP